MTLFFVSRSRFKVKTPKNYLRYLFMGKPCVARSRHCLQSKEEVKIQSKSNDSRAAALLSFPRGSGLGVLGSDSGPPRSCPLPEDPGSAPWERLSGRRSPVRTQRARARRPGERLSGRALLSKPPICIKETNPGLKKSSNIPEIYAKMFGRFHSWV